MAFETCGSTLRVPAAGNEMTWTDQRQTHEEKALREVLFMCRFA
jgi:hypothetical protein